MLLKDLKEKNPDQIIKIGSVDGTGFWYCGTVRYFLDNISSINKTVKEYSAAQLASAQKAFESLLESYPTPADYAKLELKKEAEERKMSVEGYNKLLSRWFSAVISADARIKTWEQRFENYVALSKREVKDSDMADPVVDEGVLWILVDGFEAGRYWTTDEVKAMPAVHFMYSKESD